LQLLELNGAGIGDAAMPRVGALTNLIALNLSNTKVTDAGMAHLEKLGHLERLALEGTRVSDAGLDYVLNPPLPPLTALDVRGTRISAAGVAAVKGILPRAQLQWWEPNRRAAEAVLAAGGSVRIRIAAQKGDVSIKSAAALPSDYFRLTRASLTGVPQPSRDVLRYLAALTDSAFDDLDEVDLGGSGVTDADLECLNTLACRRLVLDGASIAGPGLAQLKALPRLTELSLRCPKLSFLGMRYVGDLKQLTHLSLAGCGATDASLKHLRGLTALRELDLTGTKVTDDGVTALQKDLPQCQIRSREAAPAREDGPPSRTGLKR
jgi:hypothetical protein